MILGPPKRGATTEELALDLTPVIDMVFLLLIFFLAVTTFRQAEKEIDIALPQTRAAGPITAALSEIVVNVHADGRTIVGGRAVDEATLEALLRDAVAANAERKVSVRGDRAAPYAEIARVLDVCKAAGVSTPFLETVPIGGPATGSTS